MENNIKQKFLDELDSGWGDIISDKYSSNEIEILKYNTNEVIEYNIDIKGKYLQPTRIYTDEITLRINDIDKIKVDIFNYYGKIAYGSIEPEYINAEYKEDDKTSVYNFEGFTSVGLFSFLINDIAYSLEIHPLSHECKSKYQGASLRHSIILTYNYNRKEISIKSKNYPDINIDINPEFLNCIYNKIKESEDTDELSTAFKILMNIYLEQR